MTLDTIVVGLGGMGSAALCHLAERGRNVLGIDRFSPPHDRGSSHGESRIIRLAYYEHPSYVPLLRRSYELWRRLEHDSGRSLLRITGSLDISERHGRIFAQSLASCLEHGLAHEALTAAELRGRYPGYALPPDFMAVFQPEGGILDPEQCVAAHLARAAAAGARVQTNELVLSIVTGSRGVTVSTTTGSHEADSVVVAAGAWSAALLPQLRTLARPERQVVAWFAPTNAQPFLPERFPVFNIDVAEGHYYGFPFDGAGVKIGRYHHRCEEVEPSSYDRAIHPQDESLLRQFLTRYMPEANGPMRKANTCLFANSPDEHFIIDRLDPPAGVVIAAGFSGHGFKFCSVVGEILADLALDGQTRHDIDLFSIARFRG